MKTLWQKIKQSSFFVRWSNWEYYPVYLANIPTVFIWLYFGIRSRSLFFFSTVNPVIETGGVMGESKINILNRLPANSIPTTVFIGKENNQLDFVLNVIEKNKIEFPFVAKPNIGERGFLVEKINNQLELENYLKKVTVDFIIQDFITYALEVSVLYYRMPESSTGKITSICIKKNLSVIGDGKSTVAQLMQNYPRARFQLERFQKDYPEIIKQIPAEAEEILLEPIGNHSRGTTFLNGNHFINARLEKVFDQIALQMEGIYYGRFDMKCASMEKLMLGEDFKVMEFNGVASEPAHIYDPEYSVLQAYKDIYRHWKIIYNISKVQRKKGIPAMTLKEAYRSIKDYFNYMRQAKKISA